MTRNQPAAFIPTPEWPAGLFAVMQDKDGTPEYYRPWEPQQELGEFINKIASIAVAGIVSPPHATFSRVVSSETGEIDEAMTIIVNRAIEKQELPSLTVEVTKHD